MHRQYNSDLIYQQTRRNTFSQSILIVGNTPLVSRIRCNSQNAPHSREIQHSCGSSLKIRQTSQYRMVFRSNSSILYFLNAHFQCAFVCNSIQSQIPIVCLFSSRQSSLCDRCINNDLEQATCLCISTNSSDTIYSRQNPSISVQNGCNCSFLATASLVLRIVTTASIDFNTLLTY